MANALTILLPIKDRPQYLRRLLVYLESESCDFPILIADGSSDDLSKCVVERFLSRLKLDITYFKFKPDTDLQSLTSKLVSVSQHISTEYVVWACDDDFYDLEALRRGILFLKANPDFSAFAGEVIDFNVLPRFGRRDRSRGTLWVREENRFCSGRYLQKESVQLETATQRISFTDSVFPTEAILRTSAVQQGFQILSTIPILQIMSINFVLSILSLWQGKFFVDHRVLLLRQDNTPGSAGSLIDAKNPTAQALERIALLDELSKKLQVDVTPLRLSLLPLSKKLNTRESAMSGPTPNLQRRGSRSHRMLTGVRLYLRLLTAQIRGFVTRRDSSLSLVDSRLLTNENVPLLLKVESAIASF